MKKLFKYLFLIIIGIIIQSCSFDLNSAHIEDVRMCISLESNQCTSDKPVFKTNTAQIFISCKLKNPPNDTQVEFAWFYISEGRTKIDAVVVNSGEEIGTIDLNSSLNQPNNGWPMGDYEVVISILDTEKEPIVKSFWIQ